MVLQILPHFTPIKDIYPAADLEPPAVVVVEAEEPSAFAGVGKIMQVDKKCLGLHTLI